MVNTKFPVNKQKTYTEKYIVGKHENHSAFLTSKKLIIK